ncbi:MAG TPA: hypothetical protein VM537_35890 [Anaerolineae bacterium]|nr:hypothetical protein [Anaerolineae bacterium]
MSRTCETCKWWVRDPEGDGRYLGCSIIAPYDIDAGGPMIMPWEVRFCLSPKITFFERPVDRDGATIVDGSEYMADLITGPDFGCVLWTGDEP